MQPPEVSRQAPPENDEMEDDDEEDWLGEDEEEGEPQDPGASEAEFYDPDLDQRDEAWMTRQRGGRTSDAILSCPGCLTTVCLDCQQHQAVDGHYRAMFCMNIRVDKGRTVPIKAAGRRKQKRRRGADDKGEDGGDAVQETFHPVECALCSTHVGVQDAADEVFHLYHVIASSA